MKKVIVVGAAVVDVTLKSSYLKVVKGHDLTGEESLCEVMGGKLEAQEGIMSVGGGGTNVSVGLRRLGESVKVVTRVGDDDLANLIFKKLENEGVGTEMVQRGKGKTGLSTILVASNGGRSIVTYRGESSEIDGDKIDWELLKKSDWLQISSLGGQMDLLEDMVSFALNNGIGVGINPGKKELEQKNRLIKLISKVDFFNVNRMEACGLWGTDFENEKEIMMGFAKEKSKMVAVTDGKRGAGMLADGRWIKMSAFPNKSVDDTGAGDAFVSGVVSGILNEMSMEDVLKMGLANGASEVSALGAKTGLLREVEMRKKIQKQLKIVEERLSICG